MGGSLISLITADAAVRSAARRQRGDNRLVDGRTLFGLGQHSRARPKSIGFAPPNASTIDRVTLQNGQKSFRECGVALVGLSYPRTSDH